VVYFYHKHAISVVRPRIIISIELIAFFRCIIIIPVDSLGLYNNLGLLIAPTYTVTVGPPTSFTCVSAHLDHLPASSPNRFHTPHFFHDTTIPYIDIPYSLKKLIKLRRPP
jgi:hypothetical protein